MRRPLLALALAAGLTSFAGNAKAVGLDAAITSSVYSGLVSFNLDGTTNAITTSGIALASQPTALAFDASGNLFIGGASGSIRKMTPDGTVSYFSQSFNGTGSYNGLGVDGLAFNSAGTLFASITTSVYKGLVSFNADGSTNMIMTSGGSLPNNPTALAFDSSGNLFIGTGGGSIRKMTPDGTVSYFSQSFSGTGSFYNGVNGLAFNSAGTLFASITTVGYKGLVSFNTDGSTNVITTSGLTLPNSPTALAFDASGNLFIGTASGGIKEMTPDGMVSQFSQSFSGTGSLDGVNALAFQPQSVPEPSTYALFGLGALALIVAYRRKVA